MALFTMMTFLVSIQVFSRFIFSLPLEWSEELAVFVFIWLVYISISLAAKHNSHLKMEIGQKMLSKILGNKVYYFSDLCWLAFNIYMIFYGSKMVQELMSSIQVSAVTRINMGLIYLIVPIGFALMSIRITQNMRKRAAGYNIDEENIESVIIVEQPEINIKNDQYIRSLPLGEGSQK
ncbi:MULTISPECIES: TRAP transporter small permease [unclassified Bacillus (in: firmicutes)]|uniref:TRAP transporter small permease n=1 Tax=unclassified Bacillus (in: firmicutes) TaxID=185979 RepID=UPI0015E0C54F|nr:MULTISPECIES: TRAP transporter small permease [unclassified Bacillus (in: firmicutes)]